MTQPRAVHRGESPTVPYRLVQSGVQPRAASNLRLETRPAPPVYRPEPSGSLSAQLKPTQSFRPAAHPARLLHGPKQMESPIVQPIGQFSPIILRKSTAETSSQPSSVAVHRRPPFAASVLQRMKNNNNLVEEKKDSISLPNVCGNWKGKQGEQLIIKDTGARLNAYVNGAYVGYLSYEEEFENKQRRLRFGYILVNSNQQGNKISAALLFCFAMLALDKGIYAVVVGHPDPNLKNYWEKMGFDYTGAQKEFYKHYETLYSMNDLPKLEDIKPTEAVGSAEDVLKRTQLSFRTYWS